MRILTLSLLIVLTSIVEAQVTIGSLEKPVNGSLLDLKNVNTPAVGGVNANKGLILPRVNLERETELYPMFNDNKDYYQANKEDIDKSHIGLIVYNLKDLTSVVEVPTSDCEPIKFVQDGNVVRGLAVWDGAKWLSIGKQEEKGNESEDGFKEGDELFENVFFLKDHEGNKYTYSKFGKAGYWMTTSLITKTPPPAINSSLNYFLWDGSQSMENNTLRAFYGYPQKNMGVSITSDTDFVGNEHVGLLYSRGAISGGKPIVRGMQGICPNGWHIPSNIEYTELLNEIKDNASKYTTVSDGSNYTKSQLMTTNCVAFGPVVDAVSKSSFKGGFSFIMSAWADSSKGVVGTVSNNTVFELACIMNNELAFLNGSFGNADYNDTSFARWVRFQMTSIRCKKN